MSAAANIADASAESSLQPTGDHAYTGGINPWFIATTVLLGTFLAVMDLSVVNVALPSIARDLGASVTGLQAVVVGYTVALASLLLPAGGYGWLLYTSDAAAGRSRGTRRGCAFI